jgi:hypothetical protein
MAYTARRVDYFYTTVSAQPNEAYDLLTHLASLGINFLALNSVPLGPASIQLTLFPEDSHKLLSMAKQVNLTLDGPYPAVLVQGDDEIGALSKIHDRLRAHHVDVYASNAVTDGRGYFGYVLYVRPGDADKSAQALRS